MMTAQQYFEELSAGLDRLDASAREDILSYYREYAQEAGLSSYEQLSEHFGAPRALCDSLCAELAGTAPLPASPPHRRRTFPPPSGEFLPSCPAKTAPPARSSPTWWKCRWLPFRPLICR